MRASFGVFRSKKNTKKGTRQNAECLFIFDVVSLVIIRHLRTKDFVVFRERGCLITTKRKRSLLGGVTVFSQIQKISWRCREAEQPDVLS